jgi:RND family efflux transporter MFP subunit
MEFQICRKTFNLIIILFLFACGGKTENENAAASNITTDTETITVPVEAMTITKTVTEAVIPFTSIVKPIKSVDIISEVSGKVEKINKELGQSVTTLDVIAVIDDEIAYNQYQQALSQKLSAENNLMISKLNLESDEVLFSNNDISKIAYENSVLAVKTAEANLLAAVANLSLLKRNYDNTKIKSPISGSISRDNLELGTMVAPGMVLYRVVDYSTLKIEIGVSQDLINFAKIGSDAIIKISALDNKHFLGKVTQVSPQADEITGTYKVEIQLENTSDLEIKAGMTADIDLRISDSGEQLTVPNYAIVLRADDQFVYKITDNIAKLNKIETGQVIGGNTVITSGLLENDTIVVVGMKNLGENTPVYVEMTDL